VVNIPFLRLRRYLGFDPIFWLHHSNVDRYLSLWQAIHPDIWVSQGPEREGSMGFAPGTELNKDSSTLLSTSTGDNISKSPSISS
jgi:tyrosinase